MHYHGALMQVYVQKCDNPVVEEHNEAGCARGHGEALAVDPELHEMVLALGQTRRIVDRLALDGVFADGEELPIVLWRLGRCTGIEVPNELKGLTAGYGP